MNHRRPAVLLTGASGFIGQPSIEALVDRGFSVHAVSKSRQPTPQSQAIWHQVDLLSPSDRRLLIEKVRPTHLLHLSWYVDHGRYWTAPENEDWVAASLNLLELFAKSGGRRATMVGTCAEYDWNRSGTALWRERDLCKPRTRYGRSKLALAIAGAEQSERLGVSFAWARLFFTFGFNEDPRRLIPLMIRSLLSKNPLDLGSGEKLRDFMDVRDVGCALASLVSAERVCGPVNVASGRACSIREIGNLLAEQSGAAESLLKYGALPERDVEPPFIVADTSRLTDEVGFHLEHSLKIRLSECLQWHAERINLA